MLWFLTYITNKKKSTNVSVSIILLSLAILLVISLARLLFTQLPLGLLLLPLLLLPLLLDFIVEVTYHVPLRGCSYAGKVVNQVGIHFFKMLHRHGPIGVVHGEHQTLVNKWDDPGNKGPLQHLVSHWVEWETILRLHETHQKQTKKRSHAVFVQGAPRFFSSGVHSTNLPLDGRLLRPHSSPQVVWSSQVHFTTQGPQPPSRFRHF